MLIKRVLVVTVAAGAMVAGHGASWAQEFPGKVIRVYTSQAGSPSDFIARILAQGISTGVGQPAIVDNRVGTTAVEALIKSPPDGHTLLLYGPVVWLLPYLRDNVPWDPEKDLLPVSIATKTPNLVVVHPSIPVKSIKELIALAKARPGELNYGSGLTGSSNHLAAELFKSMTRVNIVRVAYSGPAAAFTAVIAGQLQMAFPDAGSATQHVKSGRIRALAVTSAEPSALAPGLPTVAASGVPGYELELLSMMFAPARTPPTVVLRLQQEIQRTVHRPEVKERLFNSGVESVGSTPEQAMTKIKSEMVRMGKVIKDAGIRSE